jgi:hypothetical protein
MTLCNAPYGKTVQAAWPKIFGITGQSTSELLEKQQVKRRSSPRVMMIKKLIIFGDSCIIIITLMKYKLT